jgi:hypothetical protein
MQYNPPTTCHDETSKLGDEWEYNITYKLVAMRLKPIFRLCFTATHRLDF